MRVDELEGAQLDYWVAKAAGVSVYDSNGLVRHLGYALCVAITGGGDRNGPTVYSPSTDWAQGGPIIEREGIGFAKCFSPIDDPIIKGCEFGAISHDDKIRVYGPTALMATMRCYVMLKFGDEVTEC